MGITSITDYATHVASAQRYPPQQLTQRAVNAAPGNHSPYSMWVSQKMQAGVAPTTAVAPDRSTTGCIGQSTSGAFRVPRLRYGMLTTAGGFGALMLCDRLSHQGGLSGASTLTQTTNLPTAALTRSTTGVGVMAAIEVYSAGGLATASITASYTNSAGTAGRTSKESTWATDGSTEADGRLMILPPADGDVGYKSVESVIWNISTGGAGNFGVTLFKPYLMVPYLSLAEMMELDAVNDLGCLMPSIPKDACLFWVLWQGTSQIPGFMVDIATIED